MHEDDSPKEGDHDELMDHEISWIKRFNEDDAKYSDFYADDLSFITLRIVYINDRNEIIKAKTEKHLMHEEPNFMSRNELLRIIKNNCIENDVLSILKYNINLSPINLKPFLNSHDKNIGLQFLTLVRRIDAVQFEQTITMFQDLNDLIVIFYAKHSNNDGTNDNNGNNNNGNKPKLTIHPDEIKAKRQINRNNVTKKIIYTPYVIVHPSARKKTLRKHETTK